MGGPTAAIADATAPGYLSARYARALSEFGAPRALPRSGGWLLERDIPEAQGRDAMGCYPIFACRDWRLLATDLAELEEHLVSVALVADPFGDHDRALLENCFDFLRPFKEHCTDIAIGRKYRREKIAGSAANVDYRRGSREVVCVDDRRCLFAVVTDHCIVEVRGVLGMVVEILVFTDAERLLDSGLACPHAVQNLTPRRPEKPTRQCDHGGPRGAWRIRLERGPKRREREATLRVRPE